MGKKNIYARLLTVDDVEIDYEDPALWRKGFIKGMGKIMEHYEERLHQREAATKIAKNMLLLEENLSISFIAKAIGEKEEFVLSIHDKLIQNGRILPRLESILA
jgi:hypothetical protein